MAMSERYVPVPGSERQLLPGAEEIGPADAGAQAQITVLVRRRPYSGFSSVLVMLPVQRVPFLTALRSHSGAREQSYVSVTRVEAEPTGVIS